MTAVVGLVAFALAARFELFGVFDRWAGRHHVRHLEEALLAATVLALAAIAFACRRWREVRRYLMARIQADEMLRESEERFRSLSDATTEAVAIHDNGRVLEVNAAFGRMFGMDPSEAVGMSGLELVHPDSLGVVQEHIRDGSEEPYEVTLLHRDGTPFPAHLVGRSIPYRGRTVRVVAVRDLTQRKLAEEALRESEERYRSLVEFAPDAILVHSGGRFVFANQAAASLVGARSAEELVGRPVLDIVHPDYHEVVMERISAEMKGTPVPLMEERFVRLDGTVIDVEVAGIPVTFRGEPAGQIVVRDVTRRKDAERALREAEARYRALVEQIPAVTYTWDSTHGLGEAPMPYIVDPADASRRPRGSRGGVGRDG
ncbi:MAG: PAS domain S-box protein [Actinobacteria bacterium]|nr:PAS domain S-box protein [Actinomycetota bacterium]